MIDQALISFLYSTITWYGFPYFSTSTYLLGMLITHKWWLLYTVFDHLFCIPTCVFEQSCQSSSWIINSLFHYLMEKCHEIIKIQWITIKNIKLNIRCWLLFHQMTQCINNVLPWRKPFLLLFSLVHWI